MAQMIVGVDPDSQKSGVAIYLDGKLESLRLMSTVEIVTEILQASPDVMFSIENVLANNMLYARNRHGSTSVQNKIALSVGRCQNAQFELMQWLDHYKTPYVLHAPQKGNWADNKPLFEKVTGWKGQSNADTRSASYFGYLGLSKC